MPDSSRCPPAPRSRDPCRRARGNRRPRSTHGAASARAAIVDRGVGATTAARAMGLGHRRKRALPATTNPSGQQQHDAPSIGTDVNSPVPIRPVAKLHAHGDDTPAGGRNRTCRRAGSAARVKTHPMNSTHISRPGQPSSSRMRAYSFSIMTTLRMRSCRKYGHAGAAAAEPVAERILPHQLEEASGSRCRRIARRGTPGPAACGSAADARRRRRAYASTASRISQRKR